MKPVGLDKLAKEEYCYLTTVGRVTGKPHRIEIWFGTDGASLYLLAGGMHKSDWVKNLKKEPKIKVRVGKQSFSGLARIVTEVAEERNARHLLAAKYYNWKPDQRLNDWARTALPVALDLDVT